MSVELPESRLDAAVMDINLQASMFQGNRAQSSGGDVAFFTTPPSTGQLSVTVAGLQSMNGSAGGNGGSLAVMGSTAQLSVLSSTVSGARAGQVRVQGMLCRQVGDARI